MIGITQYFAIRNHDIIPSIRNSHYGPHDGLISNACGSAVQIAVKVSMKIVVHSVPYALGKKTITTQEWIYPSMKRA